MTWLINFRNLQLDGDAITSGGAHLFREAQANISFFLFRLRVRSFNNSPMIHAPSAVVNIATMMMNAYLFRELSVACEETGGQVVD